MNKLEKLLSHYCPNGVEYMSLGELGFFYGGLTGKNKTDFEDGNARYITYLNIYNNPTIDMSVNDFVKVGHDEHQNEAHKGDVFFTGSSETKEECAIASVLAEEPTEPLYLNSFCFGFRMHTPEKFNPNFLKHLLRSNGMRKQLMKTASGVTRYNVSKAKMTHVKVPVPPIEVQDEIVRILDDYAEKNTRLIAELNAELEARQKQYEYYRDLLLTFDDESATISGQTDRQRSIAVEWLTLDNVIYSLHTGLNPRKNFVLNSKESDCAYITGKDIFDNKINVSDKTDKITRDVVDLINKRARLEPGLLLFASTGTGTVGRMAIIDEYHNDWNMSETLYALKVKETLLTPEFLMYYLYSGSATKQFEPKITKGSVPHLKVADLYAVRVPIPPIEVQEKIVAQVKNLTTQMELLCSSIKEEIDLRIKQYQYYEKKLFSFSKAS